ncbi:MAG: DUF933 domain-containing protein [Candidatus Muiribacteriota bacterium]
MKVALAGLKYSGKTSMFRLLTGLDVNSEKPEANIGVSKVPDKRIDELSKIYKPKKTTYASLELVDIPGIDPENTANRKFFQDIVKTEVIIAMLRDFNSEFFPNPMQSNDIDRDFEILKEEIIIQDMGFVEKRIESLEKMLQKQKNKETLFELDLMKKINQNLSEGKPVSDMNLEKEEKKLLKNYSIYSNKKLIPVINTDEENISRKYSFPAFSLKTEEEINELPVEEREEFYKEMGIEEPALNKIIKNIYYQTGLICFFTVGKDEVKAWTISEGLNAREAAGKIHSDLQKGFIRAETVSYQDFIECGGMNEAKAQNKVRLEGKDYIVKDGDILNIRFNV